MRILIAGGTGFIGRTLVRQLVKDGHECTVLLRSHRSAVLSQYPPGVRLTAYDSRPTEVDAVINLAGEPVAGRWTHKRKKAIMDSRVDATKELVDWMSGLKTRPQVFLSGSAVGFYGDHGDEPITEHTGLDPMRGFRAQVCVLWEQEANRARTIGIRVVNLRTGNVLHRSGGMIGKMIPMLKLAPIIMPFSPKSYLPWISMRDTIGAIEFCMSHPEVSGPVNLTAPIPATCGDLFQALGHELHRKVVGHIPNWAIKVALGEFSQAILDSQKVLPEKLSHAGYVFQDPEIKEYLAENLKSPQNGSNKRPVKKRSVP